MTAATLVVGFGNRSRRDDAAGVEVVESLTTTDAVVAGSDPLGIMDFWKGYERVILVDAMLSDRPAGTTLWIDATTRPPPATRYLTSHSFGPVELIELSRALDRLPGRIELIGIEAADLRPGFGLSPQVQAAVRELAERIDHA